MLVLRLCVALLEAPPAGPSVPEVSGRVALAWPDQPTVPEQAQQRVAAALGARLRVSLEEIVSDPVERARRILAHEFDRARREAAAATRRRFEEATGAYRSGELERASSLADEILSAIALDPVVVGSARLAFRTHLLRAQIAWALRDDPGVDQALRSAATLDPYADVSVRRVPPAIAARFEAVRVEVTGDRSSWKPIELLGITGDVHVEIDGVPGNRPVPPGEHLVVVRQPGRHPWGTVATGSVSVPRLPVVLDAGFPTRAEAAQRVCEALDLRTLVLAEHRADRVALQGYACGEGFGSVWYEDGASGGLARGVRLALGAGAPTTGESASLGSASSWPEPNVAANVTTPSRGPIDEPVTQRPWYKRAWVWVLIGSVVVAGATAGTVLGIQQAAGREVRIDGDSFID